MSYIYYTKFHDGQKVTPKLAKGSTIGMVAEIVIKSEHYKEYLITWANGIRSWHNEKEIIPYKELNDGITQH